MHEAKLIEQDIDTYLKKHQEKELLRFTTVGSVDDGKSTLIGRLLHDTNSVYEDQIRAVKKSTKSGVGEIDFSLFTDGLAAEREQGITIDVAYRYFTTEKRKFIIADTPGHLQYTRNMATGASTADVAIILIDARLGVQAQSRRHAFIASLLGIPNLLVAINKMDLKDYSQEIFESIREDFLKVTGKLYFEEVAFFPISALKGDNVAMGSQNTPWFAGGSILNYLETVPLKRSIKKSDFFFPIQYVLRPHLNFRGYAGSLASGIVNVGDEILVLPSGKTTSVESIVTFEKQIEEAYSPQSVTLTLKDEIDISRGDVIVHRENPFHVSRSLQAMLVWMHESPMKLGGQYWIKHATSQVTGTPSKLDHVIDIDNLEPKQADTLQLNDIGLVHISLSRPIVLDLYRHNRQAGAFIVIDRFTNSTVAAGMIVGFGTDTQQETRTLSQEVTSEEKAARHHQKSCLISITGQPGAGKIIVAKALERALFQSGYLAAVLDPQKIASLKRESTGGDLAILPTLAQLLIDQGLIVICPYTLPSASDRQILQGSKCNFFEILVEADLSTRQDRLNALGRPIDDASAPYERPQNANIVINTTKLDLPKAVEQITQFLQDQKIIHLPV